MVPGLWALLRISRAHLSRCSAVIQPTLSSSPLSFYHARHPRGLVASSPDAQLPFEREDSVQSNVRDYPIDVLNAQATIRELLQLIHQQKQKEASELMSELLESMPTDDVERMAAFRKLKPELVKHPRSNLLLMIQLGVGYASIGYGTLVRQELSPIIKYFATPEQLAQFELEIDTLPSDAERLCESADRIFEPKTSIYDLSIMSDNSSTTKPVAKPAEGSSFERTDIDRTSYYPEAEKPYEDLSEVFEEDGEEYAMMQPIVSTADHASTQSTGVLQKLVQDGLYNQAYAFLKEVQGVGAAIPSSFLYEQPAIAVVSDPETSAEEKLERFTAWFSLIPPDHIAPHISDFAELRRLLLQSHLIQLPLVMRFGLLLAEKGYADRLSVTIIPLVLRSTTPEVGRFFLDNFCQANERYIIDPNNQIATSRAAFRIKKTTTNVLGQAVRALAYSGRVDEAIALLPDSKNPTFKLTTYTYNVILQRLWSLPEGIRQKNIDLIKQLRSSSQTCVKAPPETTDGREVELSSLVDQFTADPIDFGNDLVAMLRYLKKHIVTKKRSDTAHPITIVNFISMYLATGRTRALKMLLDKALRKSFFATSNFVLAEMLFYRRLNLSHLVIKTFLDHFWMSGVPRDEVLLRYTRIKANIDNYDPSSGEDPPLQRFYPFDPSLTLRRGKVWPRMVHCNLVWDALVELTSGDRELRQLYSKLISFAEHGSDLSQAGLIGNTEEIPISRHWKTAVGAASFTPFMHRLMCYQGPAFGVRILRDMLQLGILPTVYHYTELCGFYARQGDVHKVFLILDGMERRLRRLMPPELPESQSSTTTLDPMEEYQLPKPTLVTYTNILRGFLIAKNLEGAEMVHEKLISHFGYIPGSSTLVDLAIQDLKDFKEARLGWVSGPLNCNLFLTSDISLRRITLQKEIGAVRPLLRGFLCTPAVPSYHIYSGVGYTFHRVWTFGYSCTVAYLPVRPVHIGPVNPDTMCGNRKLGRNLGKRLSLHRNLY